MIYKKKDIKKCSWRRRKLGEVMLVTENILCNRINRLMLKYTYQFQRYVMCFDDGSKRVKMKIREIISKLLKIRNQVACVTYNVYDIPLKIVERKFITIDKLDNDLISEYFRFKSKNDLHRLYAGFKFNESYVYSSHKYSGEEVLLVGLYRLHSPNTTGDYVYRSMFGLYYQRVSECFLLFLKHMYQNWSYLLFDNLQYWKDEIPYFAEVIKKKYWRP
jgi:hypothetical protein